jgi:hypothetical protein
MGLKQAYYNWVFRRRLKKLMKFLRFIDASFKDKPRYKKRQFWRAFISSPSFRQYVMDRLNKDLLSERNRGKG